MKKRPGLVLDQSIVENTKENFQSYQIKNNNSLQIRAFLLNEAGLFTKDGRPLLDEVKKDDIDFGSSKTVGHGASGEVSFARLKNGTPVALKRIPISSKSHRDEVERELTFFSSKGNSPFVMRNLGAYWDAEDGAIVIPMEWMPYTVQDLGQFFEGIEETVLRDVFFQVVSGLVYLHDAKRVIHRDIKPSNLLISDSGYVKIADFGVSKLVQTLDISSTYVGTMYFMAPERLEQGAYGFSSDVWSLGLTMIAAVTGKNPWAPPDDISLFELLGKISGGTIPTLPRVLLRRRAGLRRPQERPTCAELLQHPFLEGVTEESAVANVKMAVELMTRLIHNDTKKNQQFNKTDKEIAEYVHSQVDEVIGKD
eukprot:gene2311-1448_t